MSEVRPQAEAKTQTRETKETAPGKASWKRGSKLSQNTLPREMGANAWTWWGHPTQNAKFISKVATPRYTWMDRPNLIYFEDVDLGNYGV